MTKQNFLLFLFLLYSTFCFADKNINSKQSKENLNIDVIHYKFEITLSDTTNKIIGKTFVKIRFMADSVKNFSLDLTQKKLDGTGMIVHSVTTVSNQKSAVVKLNFIQENDKLKIYSYLNFNKNDQYTFKINYSGIPADGLIISKNKFGERTFFGDNWPDRAHNWLPTNDCLTDKAACEFLITAPSEYEVIANGSLVEKTNLENGFKLTHWSEKVPIPTKVMVFGAAKFAVENLGNVMGVPVETWVYSKDRQNGFYDFSVAKDILKFIEGYIGPYPYEKLANVESTTEYGGMENASNIFYDENEVNGNRLLESTIAHEITHQWFGDSVTEEDWSQIWLSEGFATFFQNFYVGKKFGADSLMNVLRYNKNLIFSYYQNHPAPLVDSTVTDLNNLLNPNSYQKGAYVLRMLRHLLGEKNFWNGIRLYYQTFKNKNASTKDFENCMQKVSGQNLSWFFNEWVYKPGFMNVKMDWNYNNVSKELKVKLNQVDTLFNMPVDLAIYMGNRNNPEIKKLDVSKREINKIYILPAKPDSVVLDPNQYVLLKVSTN